VRSTHRISRVEQLALCVVIIAITIVATSAVMRGRYAQYVIASDPLKQALRQRYGPNQFSQFGEEWIVRDYFKDRREGVFLDVGASHYQEFNNTYYLETVLGWSGVAIDALREFAEGYKVHRPKTRFVAMFASDIPDSKVQFFVPENHQLSSSDSAFTMRGGGASKAREVPTTTLNAVLDQARIRKIDFLSMDIELAEPKALAGFDIARFKPDFVCIEAHPEVRQEILDYFFTHGYVIEGKNLRVDPHNLYFRPYAR
jgi:FkbM family methyltransferase